MLAGTTSQRVALIGYGAVARAVSRRLREVQSTTDDSQTVDITMVLVRPERVKKTANLVGPNCRVCASLEELLVQESMPDLVVECASQGAVREYGEAVLCAGVSLMVLSTGALVDDSLRARLSIASGESGSQILVPAASVAGLDGLGALKVAGLQCVKYTIVRPPSAWHLRDAMDSHFELFVGSAREVAQQYPDCSDLVATVAIAGMGFDATEVELIVDPSIAPHNVGRIEATGVCGELAVECKNLPMRDSRHSSAFEGRQASQPAAMAIVYTLLRNTGVVII